VSRLLAAGARVVGASRRGGEGPSDGASLSIRLDVTAPNAADTALTAALDRFGRLDVLVNNAGINLSADCWEQSDSDWEAMLATNLTAPFLLSQCVARHWVEAERPGVIINICSIESEVGWRSPPQAGYAVTKGALLGLTRAAALELAEYGVRVVGIAPGVIRSSMTTPDVTEVEATIPLGNRIGTPEEIGDAVVYLASDRASYITGEMLVVDGGYALS
jgi:NAD(P)-dependent dehydrogenase (short-subunit alcohol dehydrogenase family)